MIEEARHHQQASRDWPTEVSIDSMPGEYWLHASLLVTSSLFPQPVLNSSVAVYGAWPGVYVVPTFLEHNASQKGNTRRVE